MMRLDKFLSHQGYGSRKDVKKILAQGKVSVNDQVIKQAKFQVDPIKDQVKLNSKIIDYQKYVYYLLNKPAGFISATEDQSYQTVIDLIREEDQRPGLFPVGRLDIDTTGLLLITNDGQLGHRLTSPKHEVDKVYEAVIKGIADQNTVDLFGQGFDLGDFVTRPAYLKIISIDELQDRSRVQVTIHEGKFHQVKRMFKACHLEVLKLKRLCMGPLYLEESLLEGTYRKLTDQEIQQLGQ